MKIVFLYTELAEYSLACLRELVKHYSDVQIKVVHYPINAEAPFEFSIDISGVFKCISSYSSYAEFARDLDLFGPDTVLCSGWVNTWYLRFCVKNRGRSLCILLLDNVWKSQLRQYVLTAISGFTLLNIFSRVWIPGEPQVQFAKKLGFRKNQIMMGYYSCDVSNFNELYSLYSQRKKERFPRRFLCVARYTRHKNYHLLWETFKEWKGSSDNEWELWCAGTGEGFNSRIQHKDINHLGFVQKDRWSTVIENTGVFVLPSLYEPWGVAVHEFVSAGYPLILSTNVGASSAFLTNKNGMSFNPGNKRQLISCFEYFSTLSDKELNVMAYESYKLSQRVTPTLWADTLMKA